VSWIGWKSFISLNIQINFRGKGLRMLFWKFMAFGKLLFLHLMKLKELLEIIIKTMNNLKFYWVVKHKISWFPFWIFTFNSINVWYIQLWVKKTIECWWGNNETIMNCCVFLIGLWILIAIFLLLSIIFGKWQNNKCNKKIVWIQFIKKSKWIKP
jgi:hypothetical protein